MIAFSTDASNAQSGVYLLSFLPQTDVERIVRYGAGQGQKSFAAILPANAYGAVVEAALQKTVAERRRPRHPDRALRCRRPRIDEGEGRGDRRASPSRAPSTPS